MQICVLKSREDGDALDPEKRKLWFSVFLSIVIVLSVISVAVLSRTPAPQNTEQPSPTPGLPIENFIARDIDANITELTSGYKIYGYTANYNLYELTEQIRNAGFEKVYTPSYRNIQGSEKALFVFDTFLQNDKNLESLLNALESKSILENPGAYRKAMVKIPSKVQFTSIDGNNTKEIAFDEPFAIALVSSESMPGDRLKVTIYAQVQNNQVVKGAMEVYEEKNLSLEPIAFKQDINAKIESIESSFSIFQGAQYNGFDEENLKADVLALQDVNDFAIDLSLSSTFKAKVFIDANEESPEAILQDLNKDINSILAAPIKDAKISYDGNARTATIEITFETKPAKNYALARQAVSRWIESKGLSFEVELVQAIVDAKVSFAEKLPAGRRKEISEKVVDIFAKHGMKLDSSRFVEVGYVKPEHVIRPDTNEAIQISEPVRTVLALGHEPGDYVEVEFNFYIRRDKLTTAFAVEKATAYMEII